MLTTSKYTLILEMSVASQNKLKYSVPLRKIGKPDSLRYILSTGMMFCGQTSVIDEYINPFTRLDILILVGVDWWTQSTWQKPVKLGWKSSIAGTFRFP